MRKAIILLVLVSILLVSCASSNIEYYSYSDLTGKSVFVVLDQSYNSVGGSSGYGYDYGNYTYYSSSSSSETVKLGTIENTELVKRSLIAKGYSVVPKEELADAVLVGECHSDSDYSTVTLGMYEKESGMLVFVCKGLYGLGWGIQDDLNHALELAVGEIPSNKVN